MEQYVLLLTDLSECTASYAGHGRKTYYMHYQPRASYLTTCYSNAGALGWGREGAG